MNEKIVVERSGEAAGTIRPDMCCSYGSKLGRARRMRHRKLEDSMFSVIAQLLD